MITLKALHYPPVAVLADDGKSASIQSVEVTIRVRAYTKEAARIAMRMAEGEIVRHIDDGHRASLVDRDIG